MPVMSEPSGRKSYFKPIPPDPELAALKKDSMVMLTRKNYNRFYANWKYMNNFPNPPKYSLTYLKLDNMTTIMQNKEGFN